VHRLTNTTPVADQAGIDYQRCRWCHTPAYRRLLCPVCASPDLETAHSDGVGIVTRPPRGFSSDALVQVSEGFVLRGQIVDVPRHRVDPGTPVRLSAAPDTGPEGTVEPPPAAGAVEFRLCEEQGDFGWAL
jgi:uncharacterized OB-fold protein